MTRTRLTAAERHAQLVAAAVTAFSAGGYAGTTTDQVARLAGVSQPYVIRLFGTKQQLFLAASERTCDRIETVFRNSAAEAGPDADPQEILSAMGHSYKVFLEERDLLLILLHGFSASSDPAIGDQVRTRFGRIYHMVHEVSGAPMLQCRQFMASGMLLTVMAAMRVVGPDAVPTDWAPEVMDNFEEEAASAAEERQDVPGPRPTR